MRSMRIEVKAKLLLTVPDAGNRSVEDIVLQAEQHVNSRSTLNLTCFKGCSDNKKVLVGIRLHVDGNSIRRY